MDVAAIIAESIHNWVVLPAPADLHSISDLKSNCPFALPNEYYDLLSLHDGGEGELGVVPGWFQLWSSKEVLDLNHGYRIPEYLPGFFGFGSNGGGELFAFDCRGHTPWPVVMIPFIPLDEKEALPLAADFKAFIEQLGKICTEPIIAYDTWQ